jgi:hypothetical protein
VSIRFLRRLEPGDFAEVGSDSGFDRSRWGGGALALIFILTFIFIFFFIFSRSRGCRFRPAAEVTAEGDGFHAAMNAGFFKSFQGRRLGVREAAFNAAFGKNPTSATRLHQQEFYAAFAHAVANCGDLLASFRKSRRLWEPGVRIGAHDH